MTAAASSIVHARLDPETQRMLAELREALGAKDSEVIRQAIRALFEREGGQRRAPIVGLGAFSSSRTDLSTNESRMKGFGRR